MSTQNVSLTPQQDAYLEEMVRNGEYADVSEAIRDAVRALQLRRAEDAMKLERLRRAIDVGLAELERGDYEEVDDADLDEWMDNLVTDGRP